MQGNNDRRKKLQNQLNSSKKHYLENRQRKEAYETKQTQLAEATSSTERRAINLAIPDSEIQWLNTNHEGLEGDYRTYVEKQAKTLDSAAWFLSKEYGIELHKGHPISAAGAKDTPYEKTGKLTPLTSYDSAGPNDVGVTEDGRGNVRHGDQNQLKRGDLNQLGVNSTWQYSVANFVAERPDIRDPAERLKMGLEPLQPKPSSLGLYKLALGELDVDDLQAKVWLESEYRKAGVELTPEHKGALGAFFQNVRNQEIVLNAQKHSTKRRSTDKITPEGDVIWRRNDPVLDKTTKLPVPEENFNLDTKHKFSSKNERFDQRNREFFAAEQRKNPVETVLPSQAADTAGGMFKEVKRVGGKKLFREVVRKMGGSNNVLANISGDVIGTIMDGVTYAQTKDSKALTDLCLSGGQALTSLGALGIACLPIPGARPGAFALMKVGDNIASVERIYNLMGGTSTIDRLLKNGSKTKIKNKPLKTTPTRTKVKV